MVKLSETEKSELLKRIDNREAEKQDLKMLSNLKPQVQPLF